MNAAADTIVVVLTAPGRAALASVLAAGPRAIEAVATLFHSASGKSLARQPLNKIIVGRWQSPTTGEEVVACRRTAEQVEIHCHGGSAASRAIVAALVRQGCVEIDWRAWIARTEPDQIAADARITLASAPTERTAAILWDQYQGALARALDELAATIGAGDSARASNLLDRLLAAATVGRHLIAPWHVVLAGRPNVGKSSLINALLGYERAVVHPTAGTTRDLVGASAALDGWPVELTDTAGLRASADPLEAAGVQLTQRQLAAADLVVLVFDCSLPWSGDDAALLALWPQAMCVENKCDLPTAGDRPAGLLASALTGQGIPELGQAIAARLVPNPPALGQAVPFTGPQIKALQEAARLLAAGELAAAERQVRALC